MIVVTCGSRGSLAVKRKAAQVADAASANAVNRHYPVSSGIRRQQSPLDQKDLTRHAPGRTRDQSMSPRKPTRSEPPRDRTAAKSCARVTKTGKQHPTPKGFKPIQRFNASISLGIDVIAKLAILSMCYHCHYRNIFKVNLLGRIKEAAVHDNVDLRFAVVESGTSEFAKLFRGYLFVAEHRRRIEN